MYYGVEVDEEGVDGLAGSSETIEGAIKLKPSSEWLTVVPIDSALANGKRYLGVMCYGHYTDDLDPKEDDFDPSECLTIGGYDLVMEGLLAIENQDWCRYYPEYPSYKSGVIIDTQTHKKVDWSDVEVTKEDAIGTIQKLLTLDSPDVEAARKIAEKHEIPFHFEMINTVVNDLRSDAYWNHSSYGC